METPVRYAQGWNLFTYDPVEFAKQVEVLARLEAMCGRENPLARSVYLIVERVSPDIQLRDLLAEFEAAGAEEAMLVLLEPGAKPIHKLASRVL
jgi:hypothetical protein